MMEHKCEANDFRVLVHFSRGYWYVGSTDEDQQTIKCCPYCGLKLEAPKPEFDIKAYKKAADEINGWWQEYMRRMMECADRLFLGEEPAPPDVIEVSRETLEEWRANIHVTGHHVERGFQATAVQWLLTIEQKIQGALND